MPAPAHAPVERYGFLLLPRFPLASVAFALDALAQANVALGVVRYEAVLLSADGQDAVAASGVTLPVAGPLDTAHGLAGLFVVGDTPLPQRGFESTLTWLQTYAGRDQALVGGIGTGAWLLARAGLLDGYRATIHWPYAALFGEEFPATIVSSNRFEMDRQRLTCAAGDASLDLVLNWLVARHGDGVVGTLLDHFGVERRRGPGEPQRVPLAARIGGGQPKLTEAVSLMEANFEEPLPTEEIARLVGVSRRQLERLFKQYLNSLPSRYYQELRLNRARQLLQQTSQSILQIGLACGFSSGPHFSSAYRTHFGITPREQRSKHLAGTVPPEGNA